MSFIELRLDGDWEELTPSELSTSEANLVNGRVFRALNQAHLSVVEPEVMIRRAMR